MTKELLQQKIVQVKRELEDAKRQQTTLEDKWDVLIEFYTQCNKRAEAFMASVARRKTKLSGIDSLLGRMKSALLYKQQMGSMLTGQEYIKTKNSIDALMADLDKQKRSVKKQIEDVEKRIRHLKQQLKELQYDYDHYPEEETSNG